MLRVLLLTALAMVAFAANSLLCRMALGGRLIDAASFTTVRLVCGAVVLVLIVSARRRGHARGRPDWLAASMLYLYALAFSFAYLSLTAGTGALILFGAVQITMLGAGLRAGERLPPAAWLGLGVAIAGLIALLAPGLDAPSPSGAALMAVAGVAWGLYSLRGRGVADPLGATAGNFLRSVPLALLSALALTRSPHAEPAGLLLAAASGAIASGLGYVLWYAALSGLTATRAAVVQLSVPVITAFGGVLLLDEHLTLRLVAASAAVLGGIALALTHRRPAGRS